MADKLTFERKLLRAWLELEELRAKTLEAAEKKDYPGVASGVTAYIISAASCTSYQPGAWFDVVKDWENAIRVNLPEHPFPLLKSREKNEKMPWEYPGRTWYYWLHVFSTAYGWDEAQIGALDIDTAIGLLQEILISEQQRKEWEWSLTEIAYPYNETTKKSEFHPLPRPDWMKKIVPRPKKMMIRADMLPQGLVIGAGQPTES